MSGDGLPPECRPAARPGVRESLREMARVMQAYLAAPETKGGK